jgi:tetrahydromethanopterin S-methyltransferase subunit F
MSAWVRLLAALTVAGMAGFAVFAFLVVGGYGVMWLFIYGDSTWPAGAKNFAQIGLPAIGLIAGLVTAVLLFRELMPRRRG